MSDNPIHPVHAGLSVVPVETFNDRIRNASEARLMAFVLDPESDTTKALAECAEHGGKVNVEMAGDYFPRTQPEIRAQADASAQMLRDAGAKVWFSKDVMLHAKGAILKDDHGAVSRYLTDRNYPKEGPQTIIQDTRKDDAPIIDAMFHRQSGANDHLTTLKGDSYAALTDVVEQAPGNHIRWLTESLNTGPLVDALAHRAESGDDVAVMMVRPDVKKGSDAALQQLVDAGAHVKLYDDFGAEKLLVVGDDAGHRVGAFTSTNGTPARPTQLDHALVTDHQGLLVQLDQHFDTFWNAGSAWRPGEYLEAQEAKQQGAPV